MMKRKLRLPNSTVNKSILLKQMQRILLKRYAVEKLIPLRKLFCITVIAFLSFILFQLFWIAISTEMIPGPHWKIVFEMSIIAILVILWRRVWGIIGQFIPKFVLIGLLGWFLIGANIIPTFIDYDDTAQNGAPPQKQDGQVKSKKDSISLPISRFFSLYEDEIDTEDTTHKEFSWHYLDTFIAPVTMPIRGSLQAGKETAGDSIGKPNSETTKSQSPQTNAGVEVLRFCCYVSVLLIFVLFFDLFFTVAVYKRDGPMSRFLSVFSISASEREASVKRKLFLFCICLLLLAVLSLNYLVLFLVLLLLAAVFIFKWEIEQRGQNHKLLSRAVLFVFLAHVFSLLSGEILFLTLFPVYTLFSARRPVFHIYDSIVLGWTIILGSMVTLLLGIITQVIWSGRRMTEELKD